MKARDPFDPPPCCERCGELCADARPSYSITGERLCRACVDEEEQDIEEAEAAGFDFTIGLGKEPR